MPSIIFGIDPGFDRMGFGVIRLQPGRAELRAVGIMTTPKEEPHGRRLRMLHDDLRTLLEQHRPDLLAIETLFFSKNVTTAMKVAEARGIVLMLAADYDIPVAEFGPSQVKLAVTGNGRADKAAVQQMVARLLGLPRAPKPDDAADALAIALTAAGSGILGA
jgi:crossover junction endodeoxyribonuclease RuvC